MKHSVLNIGATKEAITAARDAIMKIMAFQGSDALRCAAIEGFVKVCGVEHTLVQDCVFGLDTPARKPKTKRG